VEQPSDVTTGEAGHEAGGDHIVAGGEDRRSEEISAWARGDVRDDGLAGLSGWVRGDADVLRDMRWR
jgi:hypothetical protein